MTKTSKSGNAVGETIRNMRSGQEVFESIDCTDRNFGFKNGKRIHLRPKMDGVPEFTLGDAAEPLMLLAEHEGATFCAHALEIAFEDGGADILTFERKASSVNREVGADG